MAFSVFDSRRGSWSVRWKAGGKQKSRTVLKRHPGWKENQPTPKEPLKVAEFRLARQKEEDGDQEENQDYPIAKILDDWRERQKAARRSVRTKKIDKLASDRFLEWCESRSYELASHVDQEKCQAFLDSFDLSYLAVKSMKDRLAAAWRYARDRGKIPSSPWVATVSRGFKIETRRDSWSPEQVTQIASELKPWMRAFFIVGCNTGLRVSALRNLEWRDVKFFGEEDIGFGEVIVRPELDKIGKGYKVPMSQTCRDALKAIEGPRFGPVFLKRNGKPIASNKTPWTEIGKAVERAGLPETNKLNHNMRRTFGRQAVLGQLTGRPIPIYVVSKWLGHTSVKTTEIYLDVSDIASHEWMKPTKLE